MPPSKKEYDPREEEERRVRKEAEKTSVKKDTDSADKGSLCKEFKKATLEVMEQEKWFHF